METLNDNIIPYLYKLEDDIKKTERGKKYLDIYYRLRDNLHFLLSNDKDVEAGIQKSNTVNWLNRLADTVSKKSTLGDENELISQIMKMINTFTLSAIRYKAAGIRFMSIELAFKYAVKEMRNYRGMDYNRLIEELNKPLSQESEQGYQKIINFINSGTT